MLIDVVQYLIDLGVVAFESPAQFILYKARLLGATGTKRPVQKCHQFQKYRLIQHILPKFPFLRQFVNEVHESLPLLLCQADPVAPDRVPVGKAVVQIGLLSGNPF